MFQNFQTHCLPKAACRTPSGTVLYFNFLCYTNACNVYLLIYFCCIVGSHFFRPWETPDPAPHQAPAVPQAVQAPNGDQHDLDVHQQDQNDQLLVPQAHQHILNVHQPPLDAPQPAQNAQLNVPNVLQQGLNAPPNAKDPCQQVQNVNQHASTAHQQAPCAQLPTQDASQHAPSALLPAQDDRQQASNAQLPAPDTCQQAASSQLPAPDAHQPAQMAHQPPQNSSPFNPYSQHAIHGTGPMNSNMKALGGPGRYFPVHQSTAGSAAPTYLPWMASMHPPLPAPQQIPHFPVPPAPLNPGFYPTAPGFQQPTYPVPPSPPMTVKAQHGRLLEEISKLCRKSGSQWIVAISEDYMKQVQRVEKHRANALKQHQGDLSVHAHYDQQRLQIISQTQSQLQAYRDSEMSSNAPGTSKDATTTPGTSNDASNEARTCKGTADEHSIDDTNDDNNAHTDSSKEETDSEPENQQNDDNAVPTRTSRFSTKTKQVLETWYVKHLNKPYAGSDAKKIAKKAGITEEQVKKWLSNRRTRDKNTRSRKPDSAAHMGGPGYHPYW